MLNDFCRIVILIKISLLAANLKYIISFSLIFNFKSLPLIIFSLEMSSTSSSTPSSFGGLKLQSQSSLDFSRPGSSEESSSKSHKSKKKKKKNKHKHKHKHKQDRPDKPESFFRDKERSERHHYSSAGSNSPGTQPPSSPEFQVI